MAVSNGMDNMPLTPEEVEILKGLKQEAMTAIEWIEKAQEVIKSAVVGDYRFSNAVKIDNAIKYLNEAKELIKEADNVSA